MLGLAKANTYNFFDLRTFDVNAYEHYEKVEKKAILLEINNM